MGPWLVQMPLFAGYGALMAYLPSERIAVAIAVTFGDQGFDEDGNYPYGFASQDILAALANVLAPGHLAPSGT